MQQVETLSAPQSGVVGFVGADMTNQAIIVSFAGTDPFDVRNLLTDVNLWKKDFPWSFGAQGVQVHGGFLAAFQSIQPALKTFIQQIQLNTGFQKVQISGHSLGGALAHMAALYIKSDLGITADFVYTFGEPRVGNTAFQILFDANIKEAWRVTSNHDPIPTLGPRILGFTHGGTEVHYSSATSFQILPGTENGGGSNSFWIWQLNILDHLNYLGFDFTSNLLTCSIANQRQQFVNQVNTETKSQKLKLGLGIGIAVGVVVCVVLISLAAYLFARRNQNPESL